MDKIVDNFAKTLLNVNRQLQVCGVPCKFTYDPSDGFLYVDTNEQHMRFDGLKNAKGGTKGYQNNQQYLRDCRKVMSSLCQELVMTKLNIDAGALKKVIEEEEKKKELIEPKEEKKGEPKVIKHSS